MADFNDFNSAPAEEVDPAADFLAREQSELAGLEDDSFGQQPAAENQDFDGLEQAPVASEQQNLGAGLGDFELIGGDQIDGGIGGGANYYGGLNGDLDNFGGQAPSTNGPSNIYEAISQQDTFRAEPEKIRIWREEQKARLEAKDEEEETRKKELREIAKKELDDWHKHYDEQLEKTKENNRAAEDAFVKDRDEKVSGQQWEKITRLCEFNPKHTKCTKDVSRFRSILLQLKQTPLVR